MAQWQDKLVMAGFTSQDVTDAIQAAIDCDAITIEVTSPACLDILKVPDWLEAKAFLESHRSLSYPRSGTLEALARYVGGPWHDRIDPIGAHVRCLAGHTYRLDCHVTEFGTVFWEYHYVQ